MEIKKIGARGVRDSRGKETIQVVVETSKGKFVTSAPSGKSTGKFEVKSYAQNLKGDIDFIKRLDVDVVNSFKLKNFNDLIEVEKLVGEGIGGNSLFVLEACLLKAMAKEERKELYEFLGFRGKSLDIRPVGNSIGGGLHSKGIGGKKPDFQEFLFIGDGKTFNESVKINELAYKLVWGWLGSWTGKRNDEGAWETKESDEGVIRVMKKIQEILKNKYKKKVDIGLDVAGSSFFENGKYCYGGKCLDRKEQIDYLNKIIENEGIFYLEDGLEENDFSGFSELNKVSGKECLIVGDDLTTTNPERLKKAIKMKSINAIIVKPNQIGSLLKVKEVVDICKKKGIKTIISHRSGETLDDTIADLGVGFGCDFIKTGVYGKVRKAKLNRLIWIERKLKR